MIDKESVELETTTAETADTSIHEATVEVKPEKTAKAGKRSTKAIKEAEEKAEKEERKAKGDTSPQGDSTDTALKRGPVPKPRPLIERRSKAYRKAAEYIEATKLYDLKEALKLAAQTSVSKFDATVELHINLNVDPRQADQNIRSTVILPNGTGKKVLVAVLAPADQHAAATKAGADIVGEDDFLTQLDKEQLDFDVLISTPQMMPKLGKYARLLGPRGLMPNPKSGTVTTKIAAAVKEAKAGRVEYRVDKQGIIHQGIGKVSFEQKALLENIQAFIESLNNVRPTSLKGGYIKAVTLTTTMGPGIKVDISTL